MTTQTLITKKWIIITMVCFFLPFFLIAAASADTNTGTSRLMNEEQDETQDLPTQRTTIIKKGADIVITNTGNQFAVGKATIIIDQNGHQISIKKMLVPCDVDFNYETQTDGCRMIHRIQILKVHDGASDSMWKKPR